MKKQSLKKFRLNQDRGGVNSLNIPKIIKIGWKALYEFRQFKKGMKG